MSAPENPPAFPAQTDADGNGFQSGSQLWSHPGMTLRDWFAGQALSSLAYPLLERAAGTGTTDLAVGKIAATAAYELADAMLAARKPVQEPV